MHAMLSREQSDLDQGGQLISGSSARIGESCRDLVFPCKAFGQHGGRGRILERFKPGRGASHVGRRSENDCVGCGQIIPTGLRFFDGEKQGFGSAKLIHAFSHGVRLTRGMPI